MISQSRTRRIRPAKNPKREGRQNQSKRKIDAQRHAETVRGPDDAEAIAQLAKQVGLNIVVTRARRTGAGREVAHVRFYQDRWLLAQYWPSSSKLSFAGGVMTRTAETVAEAADLVVKLTGMRESSTTAPGRPKPG